MGIQGVLQNVRKVAYFPNQNLDSALVHEIFPELTYTWCNRPEENICTIVSIGLSAMLMHLSRFAAREGKTISRRWYPLICCIHRSMVDMNTPISCWLPFFCERSMCKSEAGWICSIATSMELESIRREVLVNCFALENSCNWLLSLTFTLQFRYFIVNSFNRY